MVNRFLRRAAHFFDSPDPLVVVPYRGYANTERVFLKGRVVENEGIFEGKSDSQIRNLIDNLKRFETDEVAGARLSIQLGKNHFEVETDEEGYFEIDSPWLSAPLPSEHRWLPAEVQIIGTSTGDVPHSIFPAEIYYPSANANCGIISDIDDTILQTHITSRFKLKMIYATLFKDSHQRLPMEGIPDLLRALVNGDNGKRENPIFYVSDSPWNLYDLLVDFMTLQNLPKGPILLRDYGSHMLKKWKKRPVHKLQSFRHILNKYPELPFIMLGDTASKDADYYLQMAEEFTGRIKAIYIRHTRNTKNARRVVKLIEKNSNIDAVVVKSSTEIFTHAKYKGFLIS